MKVDRYCLCGASMSVEVVTAAMVDDLVAVFDAMHTGDGHRPVTRREAGQARANANRLAYLAEHRGKPRHRHVLPDPFVKSLCRLYERGERDVLNATLAQARAKGWSLAALGTPLGITREAIRQRAARPVAAEPVPVPDLPPKPVPEPKPVRPPLPPEMVAELRALHAEARRVNGGTSSSSPKRRATVELSARLAALRDGGATWPELDGALGTRPGTVRMRLKNHGYSHRPPSLKGYQGRAVWERGDDQRSG